MSDEAQEPQSALDQLSAENERALHALIARGAPLNQVTVSLVRLENLISYLLTDSARQLFEGQFQVNLAQHLVQWEKEFTQAKLMEGVGNAPIASTVR